MKYVSYEVKNMVAENCGEYISRDPWALSNISNISTSCDSCTNYIKGHCKKGYFDEIAKIITIN